MNVAKFNNRGGVLAGLLALLWLIVFFVGMVAFFAYKAEYLRFEIGRKTERKNVVHDENTIKQLEKREELVTKKEADLKGKDAECAYLLTQVKIEKSRIEKEREEIKKHMQSIETYFQKFEEDEEADLKRLAKMYESMKPAKVAGIFEKLDIDTVSELMKRIKSRNSAKILAEIGTKNSKLAADISNTMQGKEKKSAFEKVGK